MTVNLRPLSDRAPLNLSDEEYQELVSRKENGWSECREEKEWLAKLHYLRAGRKNGKLTETEFEKREARLVEAWLKKLC